MDKIVLSEPAVKFTESGLIFSGRGVFRGLLIGTDGVNDPVITVYDSVSAAGAEIIPTTTFDASGLGLNGVTGISRYFSNGLYISIVCAGTVEVIPEYSRFYAAAHKRGQDL